MKRPAPTSRPTRGVASAPAGAVFYGWGSFPLPLPRSDSPEPAVRFGCPDAFPHSLAYPVILCRPRVVGDLLQLGQGTGSTFAVWIALVWEPENFHAAGSLRRRLRPPPRFHTMISRAVVKQGLWPPDSTWEARKDWVESRLSVICNMLQQVADACMVDGARYALHLEVSPTRGSRGGGWFLALPDDASELGMLLRSICQRALRASAIFTPQSSRIG